MSLIVKGAKKIGKKLLKKESVEDAIKRGVKVKKLPSGTPQDLKDKLADRFRYASQSKKKGRKAKQEAKKRGEDVMSKAEFERMLDRMASQGGVTAYKESQMGRQFLTESGATGRFPKVEGYTRAQVMKLMGLAKKGQKFDPEKKIIAEGGFDIQTGKTGGSVKKLKKSNSKKSKRSYRGYGAARRG